MAQNNTINIQNANFTPGGSWNFNGPVSMSAIPSATKSNLLFYDSTTKAVSYGAASAAGISDVYVTAISLYGMGFFTADPNCKVAVVEIFGGGGGGAGATGFAGAAVAGGGGGSGAYARFTVLPPTAAIGFAWNIGAPGLGGGPGSAGGNGGDTTVLGVTAGGGTGAPIATVSTTVETSPSGIGGTTSGYYGTGIMIEVQGNPGVQALISYPGQFCMSGAGGSAPLYFVGGKSVIIGNAFGDSDGYPATYFCAGGSGAATFASTNSRNGGDGGAGYLIVTQYI